MNNFFSLNFIYELLIVIIIIAIVGLVSRYAILHYDQNFDFNDIKLYLINLVAIGVLTHFVSELCVVYIFRTCCMK